MSSGYQCGRCGNVYGIGVVPYGSYRSGDTVNDVIRRNLTGKTVLMAVQELRQVMLLQCIEGRCPVTWRALLWRAFGKRFPRCSPQPGWRHRLRSLRRGDPLLMSDNAYLRREGVIR